MYRHTNKPKDPRVTGRRVPPDKGHVIDAACREKQLGSSNRHGPSPKYIASLSSAP